MVSGSEPHGGRWVLAGFGIFARNQLARWFGVAVAAVNLTAALTSSDVWPTVQGADVGALPLDSSRRARRTHKPQKHRRAFAESPRVESTLQVRQPVLRCASVSGVGGPASPESGDPRVVACEPLRPRAMAGRLRLQHLAGA